MHSENTLSHYTSIEGMLAIIENNSFWMTDHRFLNDPLELIFGSKLIRTVFDTLEEEISTNPFKELVDWDYFNRTLYDPCVYTEDQRYFTTSFCKAHDKLEQWIHYGQQTNGVSLVFDESISELFESVNADEGDIEYIIDGNKDKVLNRFGRETISFMRHLSKEQSKTQRTIKLMRYVLEKSIYIKSHNYSSEEEYRFVASTPSKKNEIQYRARGNALIPYITAKYLDPPITLPLKSIIIGPGNPNPEYTKLSIRTYLMDKHISHIGVYESQVNYRL